MVSRLMLNLRQEAIRRSPVRVPSSIPSGVLSTPGNVRRISTSTNTLWTWASKRKSVIDEPRTFEQTIIGNLGAPVSGWFEDDDETGEDSKGAEAVVDVEAPGNFEMDRMTITHEGGIGSGYRKKIAVEVTQEVFIHDEVETKGKDVAVFEP